MWRRSEGELDDPKQPIKISDDIQTLPDSAEDEFITTLLGKIAMSWGMARSSTSSGRISANSMCQELGLCLETLGARRIDAVLIATERERLSPKLAPLKSVVDGELQPNDEYALSSCEEIVFFVRLLHGALRRCREENAKKGPSRDTVAILMKTSIEILYLSQFQYGSVVGRVVDASLGLIEEIGKSTDGHLPKVIKDSLHGCLETSCETQRKHFKLRCLGKLQLHISAIVELVNFLETIVHSPGGAWKKRSLLELCDGLSRCLSAGTDSSGAYKIFLKQPINDISMIQETSLNVPSSSSSSSPPPLSPPSGLLPPMIPSSTAPKSLSQKSSNGMELSDLNSIPGSKSGVIVGTRLDSPLNQTSTATPSAFSSLQRTSSHNNTSPSMTPPKSSPPLPPVVDVSRYQCFQVLAERLIPWATGRRKKIIVSPCVCHLLCFCPDLISDAVIAIRRRQNSSWSVTASTSFSTTPCVKFLVDTYRNLTNSNALISDVALNNVLIFARFAASMVKHVNMIDAMDHYHIARNKGGSFDLHELYEDSNIASSSTLLAPFLPLLSLVDLYEERVLSLLIPKALTKTSSNVSQQVDEIPSNSSNISGSVSSSINNSSMNSSSGGPNGNIGVNGKSGGVGAGSGGESIGGGGGGGSSGGNSVNTSVGGGIVDNNNDDILDTLPTDASHVSRIALCTDYLEAQYYIKRKHFFSDLSSLCFDHSRSETIANALITSIIRCVDSPSKSFILPFYYEHTKQFHKSSHRFYSFGIQNQDLLRQSENSDGQADDDNSEDCFTFMEKQDEYEKKLIWCSPEGQRIRDALLELFFHICQGVFTQASIRWPASSTSSTCSTYQHQESDIYSSTPLNRFNLSTKVNDGTGDDDTGDGMNKHLYSLSHMFFGINISSYFCLLMDIEYQKELDMKVIAAQLNKEEEEKNKNEIKEGEETENTTTDHGSKHHPTEEIGELSRLLRSGLYLIRRTHNSTPQKNSSLIENEQNNNTLQPSPPSSSSTASSTPRNLSIDNTNENMTPTAFSSTPSPMPPLPSPSNFMRVRSSSPPLLISKLSPNTPISPSSSSSSSSPQPTKFVDQSQGNKHSAYGLFQKTNSKDKSSRPLLPKLPSATMTSPSRVSQECLYSLLRLLEDAPFLVIGCSAQASKHALLVDDTPTVGYGICATEGCLRLSRVLEHLCCLLPLSPLDTEATNHNNLHPSMHANSSSSSSSSSGNTGVSLGGASSSSNHGNHDSEKSLFVGKRAISSDSREIQNFGGIDLTARVRRTIVSFFSVSWIKMWSVKDSIGAFVAVSSVVLSALARQLLYSPMPLSSGHTFNETKAVREILNTCLSVLTLMNEALEDSEFISSSSTSSNSSFSSLPSPSSQPMNYSSNSPKYDSNPFYNNPNVKMMNRIKAQCEARFAAVSSLNAALLVSLCSPNATVVSLASNNMSLLCDQMGLWHKLGPKHASSPDSFSNFGVPLSYTPVSPSSPPTSSSSSFNEPLKHGFINPYDHMIDMGHLQIFRRLSDDIRRVFATVSNGGSGNNKLALSEAQQIYRNTLASLSVPLFSPSTSPTSPSTSSVPTVHHHQFSSPLSSSDCISLSLAVSTIQHRWELLQHSLFTPSQSSTSLHLPSSSSSSMSQPSPPPPPSPTKASSSSTTTTTGASLFTKATKPPQPRTFIDNISSSLSGVNATNLSDSSIYRTTNLFTSPPRGTAHVGSSKSYQQTHSQLLSREDIENWSSLSTWLCSLGGLRCYVPITQPSKSDKADIEKRSEKQQHYEVYRKHQILVDMELRWLVEVDMVSEMLKAYPMGGAEAYPEPTTQLKIVDSIKMGLGFHLSPNLSLHLFTKLHRCIAETTRDQRTGKVVTEGTRAPVLIHAVLCIMKNVMNRKTDEVSSLKQSFDDTAVATFESLLLSILSVVKELTSNLEESGRRNSVCSREDSIILRQSFADVITAMTNPRSINSSTQAGVGTREGGEGSGGNVFEDNLDLGVSVSKESKLNYSISKNFKHEVVGALFEWLYHSGIAGRFSLFSDSAAHAAALAVARFGQSSTSTSTPATHPSPSPSDSKNLAQGTSQQPLSSSMNALNGKSLSLELSYVNALVHLLRGLELQTVSDFRSGRVFSQPIPTPANATIGKISSQKVSESSDDSNLPRDRSSSQSSSSSNTKSDVHSTHSSSSASSTAATSSSTTLPRNESDGSGEAEILKNQKLPPGSSSLSYSRNIEMGQREQLFRSYFHTLTTLLASADHEVGIGSEYNRHQMNNIQGTANLLRQSCCLALSHLLGGNLDVAFRKYVSATERSSWIDDKNNHTNQGDNINPLSQKDQVMLGGLYGMLNHENTSEASTAGCFLSVFTHLLTSTPTGTIRAFSSSQNEMNIISKLQSQDNKSFLLRRPASSNSNFPISSKTLKDDNEIIQSASMSQHISPSLSHNEHENGYEEIIEHLWQLLFVVDKVTGFRIVCLLCDWTPRGTASSLLSQHLLYSFAHSSLFYFSGEVEEQQTKDNSSSTAPFVGDDDNDVDDIPQHSNQEKSPEDQDKDQLKSSSSKSNQEIKPVRNKPPPLPKPQHKKRVSTDSTTPILGQKDKDTMSSSPLLTPTLIPCAPATSAVSNKKKQINGQTTNDNTLEQLIYRMAELEYVRKQTRVECLKTNIFGDNTAGCFLLTDFLKQVGNSYVNYVSAVIVSSTEAFLLKNANQLTSSDSESECLLVANFAEAILGTLLFLLPLLPASMSRFFIQIKQLAMKNYETNMKSFQIQDARSLSRQRSMARESVSRTRANLSTLFQQQRQRPTDRSPSRIHATSNEIRNTPSLPRTGTSRNTPPMTIAASVSSKLPPPTLRRSSSSHKPPLRKKKQSDTHSDSSSSSSSSSSDVPLKISPSGIGSKTKAQHEKKEIHQLKESSTIKPNKHPLEVDVDDEPNIVEDETETRENNLSEKTKFDANEHEPCLHEGYEMFASLESELPLRDISILFFIHWILPSLIEQNIFTASSSSSSSSSLDSDVPSSTTASTPLFNSKGNFEHQNINDSDNKHSADNVPNLTHFHLLQLSLKLISACLSNGNSSILNNGDIVNDSILKHLSIFKLKSIRRLSILICDFVSSIEFHGIHCPVPSTNSEVTPSQCCNSYCANIWSLSQTSSSSFPYSSSSCSFDGINTPIPLNIHQTCLFCSRISNLNKTKLLIEIYHGLSIEIAILDASKTSLICDAGIANQSMTHPTSTMRTTKDDYNTEDAEFKRRSSLVSLHRLLYPLKGSLYDALHALEVYEHNKRNNGPRLSGSLSEPSDHKQKHQIHLSSSSISTKNVANDDDPSFSNKKVNNDTKDDENEIKCKISGDETVSSFMFPTPDDTSRLERMSSENETLSSLSAFLSLSPSADRFRTRNGKSQASENFAQFLTNKTNQPQEFFESFIEPDMELQGINNINLKKYDVKSYSDSDDSDDSENSDDSSSSSSSFLISGSSSDSGEDDELNDKKILNDDDNIENMVEIHEEDSKMKKYKKEDEEASMSPEKEVNAPKWLSGQENQHHHQHNGKKPLSECFADLMKSLDTPPPLNTMMEHHAMNFSHNQLSKTSREENQEDKSNVSSSSSPTESQNNSFRELFDATGNETDRSSAQYADILREASLLRSGETIRISLDIFERMEASPHSQRRPQLSSASNSQEFELKTKLSNDGSGSRLNTSPMRFSLLRDNSNNSCSSLDNNAEQPLSSSSLSSSSSRVSSLFMRTDRTSLSSVRAQESEEIKSSEMNTTTPINLPSNTGASSSWATFKALVSQQALSMKNELESLRSRRVFYRLNNTFYLIARRIGAGDRNALLLLILEETLPLVDPSNNNNDNDITNPASENDSSTTTNGPSNNSSLSSSINIVIDGLHFKSEDHGLPVAWFQRLKDAIQPLVHSATVKSTFVVCASTSMIDFGRDLLKYLGLVHLHPKRSPLSKIQFVSSPSALAKILPDCVVGLPKTTWNIEHTLRWRWAAIILPQRTQNSANGGATGSGHGRNGSVNAIMTANLAASTAASSLDQSKSKQLGSFICTTDEYLIVERRQRFHATHPAVPCMDLFPLTRFHDIGVDHISVDEHHRHRRHDNKDHSSFLPIVAITYLECGSFASLRFCAPDFRIITQTLRDAIIRCKQDQENAFQTSQQRNLSIDRQLSNLSEVNSPTTPPTDSLPFFNPTSASSSSSASTSSASASSDNPPSQIKNEFTEMGNGSSIDGSFISADSSSHSLTSPPLTSSNSPFASSCTSIEMLKDSSRNNQVFGSRTYGGIVSPSEVFGSFVHLSLLHMTSELLSTRRKAFRLLLQVQETFNLSLGLYSSFTPVALPGLNAALPAVSGLSKRIAAAAPQYTLDVLTSIVRWLRARITPPLKSKQQFTTNNNSSIERAVDDRLIFACLNYAEPWIINLAIPWDKEHDSLCFQDERRCPHWREFLSEPHFSHQVRCSIGSAKLVVLDVLDSLAKLSAQPMVSSSFLTLIWAKSVGSNAALTEAALLTFARIWWKLEMEKPAKIEDHYKAVARNRMRNENNPKKTHPIVNRNIDENLISESTNHQSQPRASLPTSQLHATLPSFFAALSSTTAAAPRWRSRSDAANAKPLKTTNESNTSSTSSSSTSTRNTPPTNTAQAYNLTNGFNSSINDGGSIENILGASNTTYQCLLDITAMLTENQPAIVIKVLIDELWDACLAVGAHGQLSNPNENTGQNSHKPDHAKVDKGTYSNSRNSENNQKINQPSTASIHTNQELKSRSSVSKQELNQRETPKQSDKKRDSMAEWIRVLVAIRPLRSISFHCLPLLSKEHLPKLLHIFAMLIGRGPMELRVTLFPILTSLCHTLLSALENHRNDLQHRRSLPNSVHNNSNFDDEVDKNNEEEEDDEDNYNIIFENSNGNLGYENHHRREQKRMIKLLERGELLSSYLQDPSIRLAFEGKGISTPEHEGNLRGGGIFNENAHDHAEDTEDKWNAAYSRPEFVHVPLNVLAELAYCAQLLHMSQDYQRKSADSSHQKRQETFRSRISNSLEVDDDDTYHIHIEPLDKDVDADDIDKSDIDDEPNKESEYNNVNTVNNKRYEEFQWQFDWWEVAEKICENQLLSVNSSRSFLVLAHLTKLNAAQVEISLKQMKLKYEKIKQKVSSLSSFSSSKYKHSQNLKKLNMKYNIENMISKYFGTIAINILNGNKLLKSIQYLESSLQHLSWFGVHKFPFLGAIGPILYYLYTLQSSKLMLDSYATVMKPFHLSSSSSLSSTTPPFQSNDHTKVEKAEEGGGSESTLVSPAAVFWPTILIASLAKPNTFVFTAAVDVIHSSIISVQEYLKTTPDCLDEKSKKIPVQEEEKGGGGVWSVETFLSDYREANAMIDNAIDAFESDCQINFKVDFATSLTAVIIRGLHHPNIDTVMLPQIASSFQDSSSSSMNKKASTIPNHNKKDSEKPHITKAKKQQQNKLKKQKKKNESLSSSICFLSLVLPRPTTKSPKLAVLELLTKCVKEATPVWAANDTNENKSHFQEAWQHKDEHDTENVPTQIKNKKILSFKKGIPSYAVALITVYGIEKLESFIAESRAVARVSGDDWSLSPSLLEARSSPQRRRQPPRFDVNNNKEEDKQIEMLASFFSTNNFPGTESACLAVSLLFGYFLGGACNGSKEDLSILSALIEAARALPHAFSDVRGVVLPRLAAILLNNNVSPNMIDESARRGRNESKLLIDAINSFLVLAFENDALYQASRLVPNNNNNNIDDNDQFNAPLFTAECFENHSENSQKSSKKVQQKVTSLVTNLDDDNNDGEHRDKEEVINDNDDDGIGAWNLESKKEKKKSEKENEFSFENNFKRSKNYPKILTKLGFNQLLRLNKLNHSELSSDDLHEGSGDSTMVNDYCFSDELFHSFQQVDGYILPYDMMIDIESQLTFAALSASMFNHTKMKGELLRQNQLKKKQQSFLKNKNTTKIVENFPRNMEIMNKMFDAEEVDNDNHAVVVDNDDSGGNSDDELGNDRHYSINKQSISSPNDLKGHHTEGVYRGPSMRANNHSKSKSDDSASSSSSTSSSTTSRIIRTRPLPSRARSGTTNTISTASSANNNSSSSSSSSGNGSHARLSTPRQHRSVSTGDNPTAPDLATFYNFGGPTHRRRPRSQSPRGRPISPAIQPK